MIKVVIADDHAIVRGGLRALIHGDPELELIGEASGGAEAIDLVSQLTPDVLVLDLSMPDIDGITVTRRIKAGGFTTHILILTVHEDEGLLREAIRAGASGYVLKRAAEVELVQAINTVYQGKLYVDPVLMLSVLTETAEKATPPRGDNPLTTRELDVLKFITQGYTNKQISEELMISTRTVEGHRASMLEKLNLHSRAELVRYAKQRGIVD
ncbi:MAG TPA: response regulator transcription factor [Bellilinea sp.]|nr:response regulator transcription factor [Bellilinea sp.]